jgi:hypothetical protein
VVEGAIVLVGAGAAGTVASGVLFTPLFCGATSLWTGAFV